MLPQLVTVEDCWHGVLMGVTIMQARVLSAGKHIYWYGRRSTLEFVDMLCQPIDKATGKLTKRQSEGLSLDGDVHSNSLWASVVVWQDWSRIT